MAIVLHGTPLSPFTRKVCLVLREKNIEFELNPVIPFNPPEEFIKISPLKKIPVLQDGDFTLADSSAICFYLEKQYSDMPLYPSEAKACGQALWFEEYADTALVACTTMAVFFHKMVEPAFFDTPINEEAINQALKEQLPVICDYLEKQITGKEFLVDNQLSIADLSVASGFENLIISGYEIKQRQFPNLTNYLKKIQQRDSFKAQRAVEKPKIEGLVKK